MNKLCICLKDDIFVTDYPHIVSTTLYLKYEEKYFPDKQWTDFTHPVLNTWAGILLENKGLSNVKFELFFQDGPYKLEVVKNQFMQLTIDCINARKERTCECTIKCSYAEFLSALYEAIKSFNHILFNNGMNKGKFKPVFNQSIISMRELRNAIQD